MFQTCPPTSENSEPGTGDSGTVGVLTQSESSPAAASAVAPAWSSTSHVGSPAGAWGVHFFGVGVGIVAKVFDGLVRAVRSGP